MWWQFFQIFVYGDVGICSNLGGIDPEKLYRATLTKISGCGYSRAFHKLLEIFKNVSYNFSKGCPKVAQETIKSCFFVTRASCLKVARKNKNFYWSDAKIDANSKL